MYYFVRFTGVMTVIFGALLMVLGIVTTIYGFVQFDFLQELFNNYVLAGTNQSLPDPRIVTSISGLMFFLAGMLTATLGQLLLVFADVATHTKETNLLLRALKRVD